MILTMEEFLGPIMPVVEEQDAEILSSSEEDEFGENEVLVQNLDPKAALKDLRDQLANLYDLELTGYKFWLQDSEELDDLSCLADHCIEHSGFVEVHFEIVIQGGIKKIIIFDVVRAPSEENSNNDGKPPEAESPEGKIADVNIEPEDVEVMLNDVKNEPMLFDGMVELPSEISAALEEIECSIANDVPVLDIKTEEPFLVSSPEVMDLASSPDPPTPPKVLMDSGKGSPYKVATVSDAKMSESTPVMELSTMGGSAEPATITVTAVGPQPMSFGVPMDSSMMRKPVAPVIKRVIPEGVRPSTSESQVVPAKGPMTAKAPSKPVTVRLKQPARDGPRWVVDKKFVAEMANNNMSPNPREWSVSCVLRWYLYVKARYQIEDKYDWFWRISGEGLYELTERQVTRMVPKRCLQDFWTHLELMRKCNVIAFLQRFDGAEQKYLAAERYRANKQYNNIVDPLAKTFHSGTPQLWQFLLDLLSDYRYYDVVRWTNNYGQFKFFNPIEAATMWGDRKKKPYMNYEKLSRAIRYYYEDKLIVKVLGERFTYRFTCDLKPIIGFTAAELKRRVEETVAATRKRKKP